MATQLQRAYGLASGKEPVPVARQAEKPAKKERSEKKGDARADPYPNLPRRPFGVDQEG